MPKKPERADMLVRYQDYQKKLAAIERNYLRLDEALTDLELRLPEEPREGGKRSHRPKKPR